MDEVDEAVCEHKDCQRTEGPLIFSTYSPEGQLPDRYTLYFCPEHRDALFALETTPSLPPSEWFED